MPNFPRSVIFMFSIQRAQDFFESLVADYEICLPVEVHDGPGFRTQKVTEGSNWLRVNVGSQQSGAIRPGDTS